MNSFLKTAANGLVILTIVFVYTAIITAMVLSLSWAF